jgi:hypothetical protein
MQADFKKEHWRKSSFDVRRCCYGVRRSTRRRRSTSRREAQEADVSQDDWWEGTSTPVSLGWDTPISISISTSSGDRRSTCRRRFTSRRRRFTSSSGLMRRRRVKNMP